MRLTLPASVAVMALTASTALAQQADAAQLNEPVRVLAPDGFEGRGVATPGEQLTIDYLVGQFRALGLEPGGPDGSWVQTAQLGRTRQDGPVLFGAAGFTGHDAASRDYVAERYHKPSDEWTPEWVMDAAAVDVDLLYLVGGDLSDSRAWPEWNAGAEFEAARAMSAAARE